ncbi:M13 family metallopeptidase [uncultured Endozoicomonas sp.]|uniref:M13 family metallopeptidase n=1 Tax=uncultured Endozoicomonas sp. TaxID=432652 RepID=UPI00261A694E|nr:M13 family metallopeptidase [uncultured Endozoicomonas sp.]
MKFTMLAATIAGSVFMAGCAVSSNDAMTKSSNDITRVAEVSGIEYENMDSTVRPQDDFYRYVNGQWLDTTEIPKDKSRYGSFSKLYEASQEALRTVLESAEENRRTTTDNDARKLGDFYASYMDEARINELGIAPLNDELSRIADIEAHEELPGVLAELGAKGITTPLGWYVNNDARQSEINALYVYQSGLGLPDRDYYLKGDERSEKIRSQYLDYITALFTLAGQADPEKSASKILALETRIAGVQWSQVERRDPIKAYNKMTVADANQLVGDFNFSDYLQGFGVDVDQVIVRQPSYLEKLSVIIGDTDLSTWKVYLVFHTLNDYASSLSESYANARFDFYGRTLRGIEEPSPRWKRGVNAADDVLGELLGKEYVKTYFPPQAKARMSTLVDNVIDGFEASIDDLPWMSEPTKFAAKVKLSKFTPKIGYPDQWRDYSTLEIKPDDLVGNFMRSSQWQYEKMAAKAGKPVDRSEWFMTPQTVNAYYNPVNNEIVFPAAILQPPFFNLAADDAVNYGAIGAVIGHELGHGFDDQGAKYDGDGNLRNWWGDEDLEQFKARGAKLVDQYNAFKPFDDMSINGQLTLGENIGDLGGLSVAYKAYQLSLSGKESPEIDGFTGEQRFFMGWSQIWRIKTREQALRQQLVVDPHSPGEYRAKAVLSNLDEFYEAFEVEEGDGMYRKPEDRVRVW